MSKWAQTLNLIKQLYFHCESLESSKNVKILSIIILTLLFFPSPLSLNQTFEGKVALCKICFALRHFSNENEGTGNIHFL